MGIKEVAQSSLCARRLSIRESVGLWHIHSAALRNRELESTFLLSDQHTLQQNPVQGRDKTQKCGSCGLAVSITRQKTKPQMCSCLPSPSQNSEWQLQILQEDRYRVTVHSLSEALKTGEAETFISNQEEYTNVNSDRVETWQLRSGSYHY